MKKHFTVMHPASMKPEDWLRFVDLPPFENQFPKLGLSDAHHRVLEIAIMASPKGNPVVPGSGGLRKIRFTTRDSNQGKSGAFRVYYAYLEEFGTVLLIAILSKSERADLDRSQLIVIAQYLNQIRILLEKGKIR